MLGGGVGRAGIRWPRGYPYRLWGAGLPRGHFGPECVFLERCRSKRQRVHADLGAPPEPRIARTLPTWPFTYMVRERAARGARFRMHSLAK